MATLGAVVEQLKLNNEEERQRDSNLNQNIAHSRNVQEQLFSGLSKTFGQFFKESDKKAEQRDLAERRDEEGDNLEASREDKLIKPEPVDASPFLNAIKGMGAGTDKLMKSGAFKAILGATLVLSLIHI
mgnify:FL=1